MTNKQRAPQKNLKKTPVSKFSKESHVKIIKHFQPNVIYNKLHSNCNFPEVDCNVDIKDCTQNISQKLLQPKGRNSKDFQVLHSQDKILTKASIVTWKNKKSSRNDKTDEKIRKFSPLESRSFLTSTASRSTISSRSCSYNTKNDNKTSKTSLKSKSFSENSSRRPAVSSKDRTYEKCKEFLLEKSKSFTSGTKRPKEKCDKSKHQKSTFVAASSSDQDLRLNKLKKEISLNKNKVSPPRERFNMSNSNKMSGEQVQNLRKEIIKINEVNIREKRKHLAELKSEIAQFKNERIHVFNVLNKVDLQNAENKEKSRKLSSEKRNDNNSPTIDATINNQPTDNAVDIAPPSKENDKLNDGIITANCKNCYQKKRCVETEQTAIEIFPDDHKLQERNIQNTEENKPNENVCCKDITHQEEYIRSKIYEANILIDRVKYTLFDIKSKTKTRAIEDLSTTHDKEPVEVSEEPDVVPITAKEKENILAERIDNVGIEKARKIRMESFPDVSINLETNTPKKIRMESAPVIPTSLEIEISKKRHFSAPTAVANNGVPMNLELERLKKEEHDSTFKPDDKNEIPDNSEHERPIKSTTDSTSSEDDNIENFENLEVERPKTRRNDSVPSEDDTTDHQNRYRTAPDEIEDDARTETFSNFEYLQSKLNTINEQTESDMSSSISEKVKAVVDKTTETVTTSACNTIEIHHKAEGSQVKPDVQSTGIQILYENSKKSIGLQMQPLTASIGVQNTQKTINNSTETGVPRKKLTADTTVLEITPTKQKTEHHLIVQILPAINIRSELVLQKVQNFYIDSHGVTHLHFHNEAKNVGFYKMGDHVEEQEISVTFEVYDPPIENILSSRERISTVDSTATTTVGIENKQIKDLSRFDSKSTTKKKRRSVSLSDSELLREKIHKHSRKLSDMESVTTMDSKEGSSLDKELVFKSYQLYDNPDNHDPGQMNVNVDFDVLSNIDTSVYKTFINPDGLPPPRFPSNSDKSALGINHAFMINPATLDKISSFRLINPNKKTAQASVDRETPIILQPIPIQEEIPTTPRLTQEQSSKLWDIGLYASKSIQVDEKHLPKKQNEFDEVHEKKSNKDDSFEKISLTVSYSTEETITTESSENRSTYLELHDIVNQSNEVNEKELRTVEPMPVTEESKLADKERQELLKKKLSQVSHFDGQQTFRLLRDKLNKERNTIVVEETQQKNIEMSFLHEAGLDNISKDITVNQFIGELTNSTTTDLRKVIPQIRKSVGRSRDFENCPEFTTMPVQIHGDGIFNDKMYGDTAMNDNLPHLQLGNNGRYKDEENLFCENNYPKYQDIPLRKRNFKYIPKHFCIKKHTLDSSTSDTVTMEESISEGEIKCQCSASIGELHHCKYKNTLSKSKPSSLLDKARNPRVSIRERRTYFNNWITYYVNRNPITTENSSSSNDKSAT